MSFYVICNGCDITPTPSCKDIRKELNLSYDDFVFLFAGNITPNKNQKQVVDALALLKSQLINNIKVVFAGGGDVMSLTEHVTSLHVSELVRIVGFIEKKDLHAYYYAANSTILTSMTEGFGMSIIEGYVYGRPALIFKDLPAMKDLYDPSAMLICDNRSTYALASAMKQMSEKKWDINFIREFAKKFSIERMTDNYNAVYKAITKQ